LPAHKNTVIAGSPSRVAALREIVEGRVELACGGACSFATQEAFPAIDRTSLGRLERHSCLPPALGALGSGFRFGEAGTGGTLALRFTRFAALGFILEVLVVEEVLFSRCENEIRAAIHAFENAVLKLRHGLFPVNSSSRFILIQAGPGGPA